MFFKDLLKLLNENRQFPNYAAERRVDIFINYFLADIVSARYGQEVVYVAPEFPLKKCDKQTDEAEKVKTNLQSDKLDYLCMFKNTKQPIFIELKTDVNSFSKNQAENYVKHARSWPKCIDRLKKIIYAPGMRKDYKIKYSFLLKRLLDLGVVGFDSAKSMNATWKGAAEILYLIPTSKSLYSDITNVSHGSIKILQFSAIKWLNTKLTTGYGEEYQHLLGFLESISR